MQSHLSGSNRTTLGVSAHREVSRPVSPQHEAWRGPALPPAFSVSARGALSSRQTQPRTAGAMRVAALRSGVVRRGPAAGACQPQFAGRRREVLWAMEERWRPACAARRSLGLVARLLAAWKGRVTNCPTCRYSLSASQTGDRPKFQGSDRTNSSVDPPYCQVCCRPTVERCATPSVSGLWVSR
jgi:hypothetical protein